MKRLSIAFASLLLASFVVVPAAVGSNVSPCFFENHKYEPLPEPPCPRDHKDRNMACKNSFIA